MQSCHYRDECAFTGPTVSSSVSCAKLNDRRYGSDYLQLRFCLDHAQDLAREAIVHLIGSCFISTG